MIFKEILSPDQPILYEWTDIVPNCGQYAEDVSQSICHKLHNSEIPGFCNISFETIAGFFTNIIRDFLVITLKQFRNYQQFIGVRSYGVHLDISHFLLIDPGFFVKIINPKLHGELNKTDILKILDLKSWIQVVSYCINSALEPYRDMVKKGIKKEPFILNLE